MMRIASLFFSFLFLTRYETPRRPKAKQGQRKTCTNSAKFAEVLAKK
jgi:hypothetical protein